ncbi:MAG: hypothetical protein LBJ67_10775 [Planctomycetaceae bacterium]|jgi:hypothetical protein|nr:hypothetical protein [Planctomycetaceae bacterium]
MKNIILLGIFFFIISDGFCQETPSPNIAPPTAQELAKKMMDYRKAVKSGKVVVKVKWLKSQDQYYEKIEGIFRFYFDVTSMRKDTILKFSTSKTVLQFLKTPTHTFWRSGGVDENGKDFPSQYVDDKTMINDFRPLHTPMTVGTFPGGIFSYEDLDLNHSGLYPPAGKDFQVAYDKLGDIDAWKVTYRIVIENGEFKNTYWVVPQMGFSLIRFDTNKLYSNGDTVVIHYALKAKQYNSVWFPMEMHYQVIENGQITHEEVQTIEEAFFNQLIEDQDFALEGLEIPQGTEIVVNGKSLKYWNGKKLSDFPSYPLPENDKITTQRRWKMFFIGNTILLSLIALNFYRRYLRFRNQQ